MAGRPRTKAKRVRKLLERHQQLTEVLRNLGKHYMPAAGETWDFEVPGGDVDPIPPLWRKAVFEASCLDDYIDDLLCFLELKAEKAERSASVYEVDAGGALDDDEDAPTGLVAYNTAAATEGGRVAPHRAETEVEPAAQADGNGHGEPAEAAVTDAAKPAVS